MNEPIITVDDLHVIYNEGKSNEVRALDGVTVGIYPQEYVTIFGPSGCGKSTLLYSIAALERPTRGSIVVDGLALSELHGLAKDRFRQKRIGMIFQAFYLIPSLSIIDNVCLPQIFRGEKRSVRLDAGMNLLRRFGIAEQAQKFPEQLSGGQKQRVAISRALINDPDIILADEPVGNLDTESAENVLKILDNLNRVDKKTIVLVTHNPDHVHFADRVLHMKDGKVVEEIVHREKRPQEAVIQAAHETEMELTQEMRILMQSFRGLSPRQVGMLLVPFKAKQLLSHITSSLTDEQLNAAENLTKELLFHNIQVGNLDKKLDLDLNKGGAGWDRRRAKAFAVRIGTIMEQASVLTRDNGSAVIVLSDHLVKTFDLTLDQQDLARLRAALKLRIENKLDRFGFLKRLDLPHLLGGVGLYKSTAEKVMREVEIIMLIKYSK